MADLEGLLARYEVLSRDIVKLVTQGKRVLVVTHIDADGLASGSIVFASLMRKGADVAVRSIPDLDRRRIKELERSGFDFYVFTDLASTLIGDLEMSFDGRYLVIDHHQLAGEDMNRPSVVNAWQYGYDGGKEACSSTMAYLFASAIDSANRDLSGLAVVGALADRQDGGQGRSLTGLNRRAVEDAQAAGLLTVSRDLTFTGRETRPVHESIALTSTPQLAGLSGNKDAVLAVLLKAGMQLRDGPRWRTISELSTDEKKRLTEVIAGALGDSGGATDAIAGLIGEVYNFQYEDSFTPLRDAREFGTLLNACGRIGVAGVGLALCLGDRGEALKAATNALSEYRLNINKALQGLMTEGSRLQRHGKLVIVRANGLVDEKLLGPVTSIITSSQEYRDMVAVAITESGEAELKVSSRVGDSFAGTVNLGLLMRDAAEAVRGVGGGHTMAAGAKIPLSAEDAFVGFVIEKMPE